MSREIKFRQRVENKWHYWGFIQDQFGLKWVSPITHGITFEEAQKNSQQFTGLKDKNGEEIYEEN